MSSRRSRHEPQTCSELSSRIMLWNASVVQKTLHINLTGWGNQARQEYAHRKYQTRRATS